MVNKKENGVSLLALVVTIIVLIIIAGAVIANIRGNSGIINQSANADKKKLTSEEKEAVQWAASQAVADETNKSGVIADKTKIQEKLNTYIGDADSKKFEYNIYGPGDTYINKILTADIYVVKFQNTGNAYIIDETGNGLSAKCTVVVENKVQRITASPNSAAIKVGDTFTSKITCSPSDTTEQIVCVNSNSKVISTNMIASGNGTYNLTVNGIAIGNATITIKNSSSTVYAQISVNVGLHISRGWSDAGAVSSGWKQLGDLINNTACSTIKSIKGSANIGANSMWSDRYFGLRIMALDTSGNWVEIWSRYSGTFTWNFGKDRYYSADISLTPNKVYYSFALQFMYSTNVDSGGAKYSNFSIDIGT